MKRLQAAPEEAVRIFGEKVPCTEIACGKYAQMVWPRIFPLMHFEVKWYRAPSFGNIFSMYTRAGKGMMELATLVFTPNVGTDVPLLLIDLMKMKKKQAAFVEFYDCTENGAPAAELQKTARQFADIPDYPEKPAWYVKERTPYSLIKGGKAGTDDQALEVMLLQMLRIYAVQCSQRRETEGGNLTGLENFVNRMVQEGNPASATLCRVLGAKEAEVFFRKMVMPLQYQDGTV